MSSRADVPYAKWWNRRMLRGTAAVMVAFFAALLIVPGQANAEASIAVELEVIPPVYWLNETDWQVTVTNPGTEPLTAVVVDATKPGSVIDPATLAGPVVAIGNADDVLDPGEQWLYSASGFHHPAGVGIVSVSATAPDTTRVSATVQDVPEAQDPVEITFSADKTAVVAGETVTWDVSALNRTSTPLLLSTGAPEGRILYPDWPGPIPYSSFGEPVQRGADGDDTFGPGETWVWRYSAVLTVDGSFLAASIGVARPEFPFGGVGSYGESAPVSVASAPTTTVAPPTTMAPMPPPSGDLPATGADDNIARIALLTLVVGSALLFVGRRSSVSHR